MSADDNNESKGSTADAKARKVLTDYLETEGRRKTPERFAVLEAIYAGRGTCTFDDILERLEARHFLVSRATVYNSLQLFLKLGLVAAHRIEGGMVYEGTLSGENCCRQICTRCGRIVPLVLPDVEAAMAQTRTPRFRRDFYSLTVYGLCGSCLRKMKKNKNK